MWLATVLLCSTPQAESCGSRVNTKEIHETQQDCLQEVKVVEQFFIAQGVYFARGGCFQIGANV